MKGLLAWIIFALASAVCLLWIGFGIRDDLREDDVFGDVIQERIERARTPDAELHIGVVGDWGRHGAILQGVRTAARTINARGGILGRKVVLDSRDDKGTVGGALTIAQAFSTMPEMPFVIGHTSWGVNAEVAQNYEFYGLLRISPNTSGGAGPGRAFSLLFENGEPPRQTAGAVLELAGRKGWTRLGLLYAKNDHAMRQARRFESLANKEGMRIPLSFGYEGRGSGVARHMQRWKRELELDAMVLTVEEGDVVGLISACRVLGIDCPFIVVGERPAGFGPESAEDLGELHFLEPARADKAYQDFARAYAERFGVAPSADAARGHDALSLLARAVERAESFVPADVAAALRDAPVQDSLTGTVAFDDNGSAIKRPLRFSQW